MAMISASLELRKIALAMLSSDYKLHARPLFGKGAQRQKTCICLTVVKKKKKKNWSRVPDGCLTPR
jgi:hypothetical protein